MLDKLATLLEDQSARRANVIMCDDVEKFVEVMFGPRQHDAHCKPWRFHKFCQEIYGFTPDYSRRWQ